LQALDFVGIQGNFVVVLNIFNGLRKRLAPQSRIPGAENWQASGSTCRFLAASGGQRKGFPNIFAAVLSYFNNLALPG
jgi:hypothetical protein